MIPPPPPHLPLQNRRDEQPSNPHDPPEQNIHDTPSIPRTPSQSANPHRMSQPLRRHHIITPPQPLQRSFRDLL